MVIGVDWLSQFSPVLFDFLKGGMTFTHEDTRLEFHNEAIKEEF